MKSVLLFLSILAPMVGCAILQPEEKQTPDEIIRMYMEKRQFDEARAYSNSDAYRKGWRMGNITAERIDAAEKCSNEINACDSATTDMQLITKCRAKISHACTQDYNFPEALQDRIRAATRQFARLAGTIEQDASKMCDSSMKWGYMKQKNVRCDYCVWMTNADLSKLHGQFDTQSACEEDRLLLDPYKWETLECKRRYLGPDKNLTVYQLKVLLLEKNSPSSMVLQFGTREKCEMAATEGFVYYERFNTYDIKPAGSAKPVRFVGKCEQKVLPVCRKHEAGPSTAVENIL